MIPSSQPASSRLSMRIAKAPHQLAFLSFEILPETHCTRHHFYSQLRGRCEAFSLPCLYYHRLSLICPSLHGFDASLLLPPAASSHMDLENLLRRAAGKRLASKEARCSPSSELNASAGGRSDGCSDTLLVGRDARGLQVRSCVAISSVAISGLCAPHHQRF